MGRDEVRSRVDRLVSLEEALKFVQHNHNSGDVVNFRLPWGSTPKSKKDAKRLYDLFDRDPESVRHHNSKGWKSTRLEVLEAEPLCRRCKERGFARSASIVDHIIPRSQIPRDQWLDKENLQPLCGRCHNIKRAEDFKQYGET